MRYGTNGKRKSDLVRGHEPNSASLKNIDRVAWTWDASPRPAGLRRRARPTPLATPRTETRIAHTADRRGRSNRPPRTIRPSKLDVSNVFWTFFGHTGCRESPPWKQAEPPRFFASGRTARSPPRRWSPRETPKKPKNAQYFRHRKNILRRSFFAENGFGSSGKRPATFRPRPVIRESVLRKVR